METEKTKVPEALQDFMYGLIKEAQRHSFIDFCERWGVDFETDYQEIEKWFALFGVEL